MHDKKRISIIGAGPAGGFTAYLLAKKGYDVKVYEEHEKIGLPVQCTGIVTSAIKDILQLKKEFVANKITRTRIHSPNEKFVEIKMRENIILDRTAFDSHICRIAKQEGAKIYTNHKFADFDRNKIKIINAGQEKFFETDYVIGADGPNSSVAKASGIYGKRKFFVGAQATAKLKNDNAIEFFPYISKMAWICPENEEYVRIGIADYVGLADNGKVNEQFRNFLKGKLGENYESKIVAKQGGLIPLHNPKLRTQDKNVMLVGDSATQVKATTAGGIIQSMIAAQAASYSIEHNKSYEKEWRKRIGNDLWLHLQVRKMLDNFKTDDYNSLIEICSKEKTKVVLEKYDRDFISKLAIKMVFREPRLLFFLKRYFF